MFIFSATAGANQVAAFYSKQKIDFPPAKSDRRRSFLEKKKTQEKKNQINELAEANFYYSMRFLKKVIYFSISFFIAKLISCKTNLHKPKNLIIERFQRSFSDFIALEDES